MSGVRSKTAGIGYKVQFMTTSNQKDGLNMETAYDGLRTWITQITKSALFRAT